MQRVQPFYNTASRYPTFLIMIVHGKVPSTGKAYDNRFCFIINIADRKIIHWRDYMDSLAVMLSLDAD